MSPRRSPRLKGPSPKPELPQKPRPPKRVNDVAADSVRAANYKVELAAWEAACSEAGARQAHEDPQGEADGSGEGGE